MSNRDRSHLILTQIGFDRDQIRDIETEAANLGIRSLGMLPIYHKRSKVNGMTVHRIREIAMKCASDYPGVKSCDPLEQLYAIEATCQGLELACKDLQILVVSLGEKFGMTPEEIYDFSRKERMDHQ